MTREETIKILEMLSAFYAGGRNDPRQQVIAWHLVLERYNFDDAMAAVIRFAENDTRDYATFPAVGRIVGEIRREEKRQRNTISEIIRAVGYGKGYAELSEGARALIPEEMYLEWLGIDSEEFVLQQDVYAGILKKRRALLEDGRG